LARYVIYITFTGAACPEGEKLTLSVCLQITGNTIFNVLKLGELEVNEEDRPLYPPRILAAEVLSNPFDDIVPRDLYALGIKRKPGEEDQAAKPTVDRPQIRKKRNVGLLSFGEEEGAEEVPQFKPRMKSSHVAGEPIAAAEAEPKRSSKAAADTASDSTTASSTSSSSSKQVRFIWMTFDGRIDHGFDFVLPRTVQDESRDEDEYKEERMPSGKDRRPSERKRRRSEGSDEDDGGEAEEERAVIRKREEATKRKRRSDEDHADEKDASKKATSSSAYDEVMGRREREKEERKKEFNDLKKSLLSFKKQSDKPAEGNEDKKDESTLDPLEQMRLKYKDKARKRTGDRQKQVTLSRPNLTPTSSLCLTRRLVWCTDLGCAQEVPVVPQAARQRVEAARPQVREDRRTGSLSLA
jgi:peptidyl-prolyl cis-trans isomerase SDCCAG10